MIETILKEFVDQEKCALVLTTGGTGPAPRDVTPDATMAVADRVMEGFGEAMRMNNLKYVPTAILSRQVAVIRQQALIHRHLSPYYSYGVQCSAAYHILRPVLIHLHLSPYHSD